VLHIVNDDFVGSFALAVATKNYHQAILFINTCRVLVTGFYYLPTRLLNAPCEVAEVQTIKRVILEIFTFLPYSLSVIVSAEQEHLVFEHHWCVVGNWAWSLVHWTLLGNKIPVNSLFIFMTRSKYASKVQFPNAWHRAILDVKTSHDVHLFVVKEWAMITASLRSRWC